MSVIIAGSGEPLGALAAALDELGVVAEAYQVGAAGAEPSGEALARALVGLERVATEKDPDAIVAIGPGDAATAAALVAGKAGIRLISVLGGASVAADEARAVSTLSELTLEMPGDGPSVELTARRIAEALERAPA